MRDRFENLSRAQLVALLTAADRQFDEVLANTRTILYRLNVKQGGYDYLSPFFTELTGHPLAEFKQLTIDRLTDYFHPDDRERIFGVDGEIAQGIRHKHGDQVHFHFEYRLRKADGHYCWLSDRSTARLDDAGKALYFVGSAEDITAQKQAKNELQAKADQLRVLFDASQAGIILVDPAGRITMANRRMAEMFGYTLAELTGASYPGLVHPDHRSIGDDRMRRLIQGDIDHVALERHYVRKDGSGFWGYLSGRRHEDTAGRLISLVGHITDISELKQKEFALRESEQRLHNIVAAAGAYLWEIDTGMAYTFVTGQSEQVKGYLPQALLGHSPLEFMPADDIQAVSATVQRAIAEQSSFRLQHRNITPSGQIVWEEVYGAVYFDDQGTLIGLRGTGMSITDRKQAEAERRKLEQQLLHAQKLESLGVLAGGIAHDFNNILTAIIGNAELALMRLNPESPAQENLQRIEQAAARAADLARQMLAYSGKGKFVIETIDLNRLVEEMGHMLEVSISKKAVLRYNFARPLPAVNVDATQIRQIIMNLVINASEAIGAKSGVIAITTGCVECNESYLQEFWLTDPVPEGLYVFLEIADTGCGMERETMARIFDPFFTTKFTGRGLGMAAVLGIIRGHQGAIKVYSEPGKGSSFRVLLPAGERPADLFNGAGNNDHWRGQGVALLVDDEETVRAIGAEMLRELGYEVVTAVDGRDALEVFRRRGDISVVILDLTMPHMDGEQCFRELRQLDPNVRVIMSSGFSESEVTQKFAGKRLAGFVQKPYKLSTLTAALCSIQPSATEGQP